MHINVSHHEWAVNQLRGNLISSIVTICAQTLVRWQVEGSETRLLITSAVYFNLTLERKSSPEYEAETLCEM